MKNTKGHNNNITPSHQQQLLFFPIPIPIQISTVRLLLLLMLCPLVLFSVIEGVTEQQDHEHHLRRHEPPPPSFGGQSSSLLQEPPSRQLSRGIVAELLHDYDKSTNPVIAASRPIDVRAEVLFP
jgi:hypothetical protein